MKRRKALKRSAVKRPGPAEEARKTKLFKFMSSELKRHGVPGGKIVKRWGVPRVNKYWEIKEIREAFEKHVNDRLFKGTRLNALALRVLFTALYMDGEVGWSRRRYREGMSRISRMIDVPRKQLDRVLRSELKTVANRFDRFEKELQAIDRYRGQLYDKISVKGRAFSPQEKMERLASNLSLEEFKDYFALTNAYDAAGQNLAVNWAGYAGNILEWLKEHKPLRESRNHSKRKGGQG